MLSYVMCILSHSIRSRCVIVMLNLAAVWNGDFHSSMSPQDEPVVQLHGIFIIRPWRQMTDLHKPLGRLALCKEKEKENFLSVAGGFVVYHISSGFIMCLSCVISCHLTLSRQSEAAGDEMRAEMRSNFNDPCGQIASLQQRQQRRQTSILCLLQKNRLIQSCFRLFYIQYRECEYLQDVKVHHWLSTHWMLSAARPFCTNTELISHSFPCDLLSRTFSIRLFCSARP